MIVLGAFSARPAGHRLADHPVHRLRLATARRKPRPQAHAPPATDAEDARQTHRSPVAPNLRQCPPRGAERVVPGIPRQVSDTATGEFQDQDPHGRAPGRCYALINLQFPKPPLFTGRKFPLLKSSWLRPDEYPRYTLCWAPRRPINLLRADRGSAELTLRDETF